MPPALPPPPDSHVPISRDPFLTEAGVIPRPSVALLRNLAQSIWTLSEVGCKAAAEKDVCRGLSKAKAF